MTAFISPAEQRKAIDGVAKRDGLTIVEYLEELDASGGDNKRPKWNEAIGRIECGEVQALVVWNLSRFSRSAKDGLAAIERIEAAGGSLYSSAGDAGDGSDTGKLSRGIFLVFAEFERNRARTGFRMAQGNAVVGRGIHTASRMPTGYSRNPGTQRLEPNEFAPLIKELFERRAKGATLGELVKWFVSAGGSPLTNRATLSAMLKNRAYLGEARNGEFVHPNAHPAIVSQRLFDQVRAMKGQGRKHTGKAAAATLFGGIVVCDGCGRRMATTVNGRDEYVYRCNYQVCPSRATCMAHELDAEVTDRLLSYWNTFQFTHLERSHGNEAEMAADLAQAREELADAQHLLDKFQANKREYLKSMAPAEFAEYLMTLKADVADAQIAVEMAESATSEPPTRERVADLWDTWTHETRKEWLGQNVPCVIVRKSGQGRGNPVPVAERIAVCLDEDTWLHPKAHRSSEAFGIPKLFDASRLVGRRKVKSAN